MTAESDYDADFLLGIRDARRGLVLKPLVHNYLFDASFPDFSMHFPKAEMHRDPDGWFHPSTHPTWPATALYHYLVHPDRVADEQIAYMGALSITVGKAMHGFVNMVLREIGVLPAELNDCKTCPEGQCPQDGTEPGVVDEEVGSRGHLDGLLDLSSLGVPPEMESPSFEFKTTNERRIRSIEDLDAEAWRKAWPHYWAQVQEGMRLSGRSRCVVLMMNMGYPWALREFHVEADRGWQLALRAKYADVRQAVADQRPPTCCGAYRGCPSGPLCKALGL